MHKVFLLTCLFLSLSLFAQSPKSQFTYVLHTVERLNWDKNWQKEDEMIAGKHFMYLQELTKQGVVIFAGRTLNEGPTRFGIVVFEAENEAKAREIMSSDPAILGGIMTGELFPYAIALQRKEPSAAAADTKN